MNSFWPPFQIRVGLNGDPVPAQPPVNTAPPVATGTPQAGETLTATAGLWSGTAPIEVTRRWLWSDDGETWTGYPPARGTASITLDEDDIGRLIAPNVRAQNAAGQSGWVRGVALGPVVAADEPQWIVTGGAGEITVNAMPTPSALIATGGAGTITIEG